MKRKFAITLVRVLPVLFLVALMVTTAPVTSQAAKPPTKTPTPAGGPTTST